MPKLMAFTEALIQGQEAASRRSCRPPGREVPGGSKSHASGFDSADASMVD
jgi:hypothetical protein